MPNPTKWAEVGLAMPFFATRELLWQSVSSRWPVATQEKRGIGLAVEVPQVGLTFVLLAELGNVSRLSMLATNEAAALGPGMAVVHEVMADALAARPAYDAELAALPPVPPTPEPEPEPVPVFKTAEELGVLSPGREEWAGSRDFAWSDDPYRLPFCLAVVHGRSPEEALELLGGEAVTGLMPAAEARIWAAEQDFPRYGTSLEAGRRGRWTLVVEENGYQATQQATALSAGTAVAVVYWNPDAYYMFQWAVDGRMVRHFDPMHSEVAHRSGEWLPQEEGLAFGLEAGKSSAMALVQRLTGITVTSDDITDPRGKIALGLHPG